MRILITGGAGFQGSHLAEALLQDGHIITILNNHSPWAESNIKSFGQGVRVVWGDMRERGIADMAAAGQDAVFHLAGNINVDESLQNPLLFFNNNILGTYNVLEAVKAAGGRLIFTSTCEVYGDGHDPIFKVLSESAELRPSSPYAASKTAADRMCFAYYKSYGVNVTIVRPFNIFGERQKSGKYGALIPKLVGEALSGQNLLIYGDGSAERDYTHVADIVEGYKIILRESEELRGKVINLASGINVGVKAIADYIAEKLNVKVVYGTARPAEIMSRLPAGTAFAQSLGFKPTIGLWEGIDRYIAWARQHPEAFSS